jgi:hypothetical protein
MTSGPAVLVLSAQRQPQELAALGIIPFRGEQFSEIISENRTEGTVFGTSGEHTRPRVCCSASPRTWFSGETPETCTRRRVRSPEASACQHFGNVL